MTELNDDESIEDQHYWFYSYRVDRSDEIKITLPNLTLGHVICSVLWLIVVVNQQMYILTGPIQRSLNFNNQTDQMINDRHEMHFLMILDYQPNDAV